jgi:ribulose-phosphate 3-epimerase
MVARPHALLDAVAAAGADYITVHQEVSPHLHRSVERIRELGAHPGVSLNPATPLVVLEEILPYVDLVLLMTVNPGFGGQEYIPTSTRRVARLRRQLDERSLWGVELEVDGGIAPGTAGEVTEAGATVLVAGAAVFGQGSVADNIAHLRHHARTAQRPPRNPAA